MAWTQAVVVGPLIAGAKRRWMAIAWYTVLAATTAAFLFQTFYGIQRYLAYQKSTNTKLIYEPQATFPAVTFCNLNPFKKSMMHHSQELTNLVTTFVYVNKMKQAQTHSGNGAAAANTTTSTERHARKKRQQETQEGTCWETTYSFTAESSPPRNYSVWNCPNGTVFMKFEGCVANPGPGNLALDRIAGQVLASYCGNYDEACMAGPGGTVSVDYYPYDYRPECGECMTTVFETCNNPSKVGNNYNQSLMYSYDHMYLCRLDKNGRYYCVQDILCSSVRVSEKTTTELESQTTTAAMTTMSSTSALKTTTAPLATASELPTTTTGDSATTTMAGTTPTEPVTTTTEPVTTTSVPLLSNTETSTVTTAAASTDSDSDDNNSSCNFVDWRRNFSDAASVDLCRFHTCGEDANTQRKGRLCSCDYAVDLFDDCAKDDKIDFTVYQHQAKQSTDCISYYY